jgi:hypothetical protein
MRAAALHAYAITQGESEPENHRRFCQAMMDRFASSKHPYDIERTIKSCYVIDLGMILSRDDLNRLTVGRDGQSVDKAFVAWQQNALALDAYRRGQHSHAQQFAEQGYESASFAWENTSAAARVLAKAVSSLALAAGGKPEEAALALKYAKTEIDKRIKRNADGWIRGDSLLSQSGDFDHDLIFAEILTREAAATLGN